MLSEVLKIKKIIEIKFNGQSKGVTADVKISLEAEGEINKDELLKETKELYDKAFMYALQKTWELNK